VKAVSDRRSDSPATLVAIIVAARRAGDRELEREARRQLEERFGVRLTFARPSPQEETPHA
jgi:hypothetical protein